MNILKYIGIALFTFGIIFCSCRKSDKIGQVEQCYIPEKTLKSLEKQALKGSVEAA